MNVVVCALLFEDDIGVAVVEFSVPLCVLLDWLETLDSVDLEGVLASLCEESLGFFSHRSCVCFQIGAENCAIVTCFNHSVCLAFRFCLF